MVQGLPLGASDCVLYAPLNMLYWLPAALLDFFLAGPDYVVVAISSQHFFSRNLTNVVVTLAHGCYSSFAGTLKLQLSHFHMLL